MANEDQLRILRQGVAAWNKWRLENTKEDPIDNEPIDLSDTHICYEDLRGANLEGADLSGTKLRASNLEGANLEGAILNWADLSKASLKQANLHWAKLIWTNLTKANLSRANLEGANLRNANLSWVDLTNANLVETNFEGSILSSSRIYGISAWNLKMDNATAQKDLVITPYNETEITVDNLQVAQFIYLLLHNEEIRQVIDTITSKVILILGRFTPERKEVLDAIREELRKRDYLPVLFDFEKPASRDLTETISTLAHMARFVIADITDAKSIPAELERIVPDLPSVPVMPLILNSEYEYALFEHVRRYPWVLEPYRYVDQEHLLVTLEEKVIAPAEEKVREIREPGR